MEQYRYFLRTGSGNSEIRLTINDDETAQFIIDSNWMGSGRHLYHLAGKAYKISDVYGWLLIETAEHSLPLSENSGQTEKLDLNSFHSRVIYEYFKVANSPNFEHPDDLGAMQQFFNLANWNESFDLVVILQQSIESYITALRDELITLEEPILSQSQLNWLTTSLLTPDKTKYVRETN